MAELKISGKMKVKTLKANFKKEFGATLRVYKSAKAKGAYADDDATLAELRAPGAKGGEITVNGNKRVGNFEKEFAEVFGIGIQVANADDTSLVNNDCTMAAAGKAPSAPSKASKATAAKADEKKEVKEDAKKETEEEDEQPREITSLEIWARATLYSTFEDAEDSLRDAMSEMSEEEREEIDLDQVEEITDGEIYNPLEDEPGWSIDLEFEGITVEVEYDDEEKESFKIEAKDVQVTEGEENEPTERLFRKSYTKSVLLQYLGSDCCLDDEDEPFIVNGHFDPSKLSFEKDYYSINGQEFSVIGTLDYDGRKFYNRIAMDGGDEKWAEYSIMVDDVEYGF